MRVGKSRNYKKPRPVSLMVSKVTKMESAHEIGEISGAVLVKMPRIRAQDLFKLLNDELARDSGGYVTFTLEGLLK